MASSSSFRQLAIHQGCSLNNAHPSWPSCPPSQFSPYDPTPYSASSSVSSSQPTLSAPLLNHSTVQAALLCAWSPQLVLHCLLGAAQAPFTLHPAAEAFLMKALTPSFLLMLQTLGTFEERLLGKYSPPCCCSPRRLHLASPTPQLLAHTPLRVDKTSASSVSSCQMCSGAAFYGNTATEGLALAVQRMSCFLSHLWAELVL